MNNILHLLSEGKQVSIARFNDGECGAILGHLTKTSRGKQDVTKSLVEKLKYALDYRSENYFIGYPCPKCYPEYHKFVMDRIGDYPHLIPATCMSNNHYNLFKSELLSVLGGKKALYIGCSECDRDWLDMHFEHYFLYKNTNTEEQVEKILGDCLEAMQFEKFRYGVEPVILFAVGAVSRYLVAKMHEKGYSALDIGSLFDPETRGVYLKPHRWVSPYKNEQKYCPYCNY